MQTNMRMAAALAMMSAGALAASPAMEPAVEPERGSRKNKPGGNTPVPGGGAKERARRLSSHEGRRHRLR